MSVIRCCRLGLVAASAIITLVLNSYVEAYDNGPTSDAPTQETTIEPVDKEGSKVNKEPPNDSAAQEERETILNIDHLFAIQYGPLGIAYVIDPYFKWDLFPESDNILLEEAHFAAGMTAALSPSIAWWGPSVTIAPLTIFSLNVQFTHVIYGVGGPTFGMLDYDQSNHPDLQLGQYGNYDYSYRNDHSDELGEFTASVWNVFIKPSLFLQLGPIVFVYMGNFMYFHPTKHDGLYYNDIADVILSPKSWCLMNDALLLYEIATLKKKNYALYTGIHSPLTFVLDDNTYTEFAYRWKIGPMVAWTFTDQLWDYAVEEPTLIVQAHYFIHDPIREENKRIISAVVVLAFSTDWDRLISP
ncbi:MAG: hypothetical protein GY847_02045 [Proteobacteria bacterium]|nr:hypothetical protein [Pseudomonadota bacterium]